MNYKRGFTLIELLVVIAIIGILSSVVLASLNTARDKGADAAAKSNLNGARAQAELYYDNKGYTYAPTSPAGNLCTATDGIAKQIAAATSSVSDTSPIATVCFASSTAWGAQVKLKESGKFYCVDSTGYAGVVTGTQISNGDGVCI